MFFDFEIYYLYQSSDKILHGEIFLSNLCIKPDISPNTLWSIVFLKHKHTVILKMETWRQEPQLTYNM